MPDAAARPATAPPPPDGEAASGGEDSTGPQRVLEFSIDPAAAPRLLRHPAIAAARAGRRARSAPEELIWQDSAEGDLARAGLIREERARGVPREIDVLAPPGPWLPGTPAPWRPATAPGPLVPLAAFSGRRTILALGAPEAPFSLELLAGKLRAVAAERPVARLTLAGPPPEVLALARSLAADLPLLPASAALAEEGRALARGDLPRARRRGPPDLGDAQTVEAALATAIGHLLEAMLAQAPQCRPEAGPEGVHQARVALRRLRSVLRAFRPAARCAALDSFDDGLRILARDLGVARDLDVFLMGIGARVDAALPGERRIAQLLRVAEARRLAAYDALGARLGSAWFRLLVLDGLALLLEQPWRAAAAEATDRAERLEEPLRAFASGLLDKRWHRLCAEGEAFHHLDDTALHELRLTGKRLRYAAELFAPLWPGKAQRRFLARLAVLQEELGHANDAAVARGIAASLGPSAPAWAVGAVEGFAMGGTARARKRSAKAWENLMVAKPFWSDL